VASLKVKFKIAFNAYDIGLHLPTDEIPARHNHPNKQRVSNYYTRNACLSAII